MVSKMGIKVTKTICVFCGVPINSCAVLAICDKCAKMSDTEMFNLLKALNDFRDLSKFEKLVNRNEKEIKQTNGNMCTCMAFYTLPL